MKNFKYCKIMIKELFQKWNKKNGSKFYLFSFCVENDDRWQIGEKDRVVTLSDLYNAPYIVGGIDLNASYSQEYLIRLLKENIK